MEIYYSFEAEFCVYIGCRCVNKPPSYYLCIQINISHIYWYFNLIILQVANRGLTGRTVKTTADIAKTMNNVILRMDAVITVVRLGILQILAKHTKVSVIHTVMLSSIACISLNNVF